MTPEAAIYGFLAGFGVPAYASASVPEQADFPYLTYDLTVGEWSSGEANLTVNAWFRTDSEAIPNAFVRVMATAIGMGGVTVPCDGGMLWLKRGTPWAQSVLAAGDDEKVKRRYLNIDVEFLVIE